MPRRDLLLGAVAAVLGAAASVAEGLDPLGIAASFVLGGALGFSAKRPRLAWVIAVVALLAVVPSAVEALGVTLLAAGHALCAARRERRWPGAAAALALIGGVELSVAAASGAGVPVVLVIGSGWGVGLVLRERDQVAASLAERARELEEEREAHAALSVRYERARIAAELHDIVAHAISVMVVQAAAGQRLARDPELTADTFAAIAGAARQAEEDMGRLAELLGEDGALAAAPDLALVEQLVARGTARPRRRGRLSRRPGGPDQRAALRRGRRGRRAHPRGARRARRLRRERPGVARPRPGRRRDRHRPAGPPRAGGRCRGRA